MMKAASLNTLSLRLAWRNLFRNVRRTTLTCLLISSSLIVLILVDGITLGVMDVMVGSLTQTLEGEAQVNRKGFREHYDTGLYLTNPDEVQARLAASDLVAGYAPRVITGAMIASSYNATGGLVYGVDAMSETSVSRIREAVYAGDYLGGGRRELLLGKRMAELLEVKLGDRIIITAAKAGGNDISQELFRVSGLVEFGPEEMDESLAFVNLAAAQAMLGMEGRLHQVAVRFVNPEDANRPDLPVLARLNKGDTEALGWLALQPAIGAMIEMSGLSTAIVGAVLFLLTSLGVINAMFMSIYERIYEFGVAQAIGTRPSQIVVLVLAEAFFLALLACAAGLALAWLAADYFQTNGVPFGRMEMSGVVMDGNIRTRMELYQFLTFPVYVTLLTLVAAVYPAFFASRLVPSQALQRVL